MEETLLQYFKGKQRYCITEDFMNGMFCIGMHKREWFLGFVTNIEGRHFVHLLSVSSEQSYVHARSSLSAHAITNVLPVEQKKFSSLTIGEEFYLGDKIIGTPLKKMKEEGVKYVGEIPVSYPGCAERFLTPQEPPMMLLADDYVYVQMTEIVTT